MYEVTRWSAGRFDLTRFCKVRKCSVGLISNRLRVHLAAYTAHVSLSSGTPLRWIGWLVLRISLPPIYPREKKVKMLAPVLQKACPPWPRPQQMFWSMGRELSNALSQKCERLPVAEKQGWSQKTLTPIITQTYRSKNTKYLSKISDIDLRKVSK